MKKNLDWNQMTEKQKAKDHDRWRYGAFLQNAGELIKMLNEESKVYPAAQIESYTPLTWKQTLIIAGVFVLWLFLMYLMFVYLIPGNMG